MTKVYNKKALIKKYLLCCIHFIYHIFYHYFIFSIILDYQTLIFYILFHHLDHEGNTICLFLQKNIFIRFLS